MIIMCHHPGPTRMIPTVAAASWPDRAIPFPAARRPPNKGKPLWVSYRRQLLWQHGVPVYGGLEVRCTYHSIIHNIYIYNI